MRRILEVAAAVSLLVPVVAQANLVQNGGFEAVQLTLPPFDSANPADIPGWTHTGVAGDALLWAIGYADGSGAVSVAGDGRQFVTAGGGFNLPAGIATWSQTVNGLTAGATYNLTFMLAAEADFSGNQVVNVSATNSSLIGATPFVALPGLSHYWTNWQPYGLSFVALGNSSTLAFSANTSFDVGIDAVDLSTRVAGVPEPETYALLLAGLGAMSLVARRRK